MNIKENVLWDAFEEIKAHPEILQDAMQETQEDLDTLWVGIQAVLQIASVASHFVAGGSARTITTDHGRHIAPAIRAAASRIYARHEQESDE